MVGKRQTTQLTEEEQKTTTAYKMLKKQNGTLKRSLKRTQDELEKYRTKYHEADKNHAVEIQKNQSIILHEVLKFVITLVAGFAGSYELNSDTPRFEIIIIYTVSAFAVYSLITWFDRK